MTAQQKEFMEDAQGRLVPLPNVKAEDKLEDQLVSTLYEKATDLQTSIKGFKVMAFDEVESFVDLLAEKYSVSKGGKKGNMTLTSYDGKTKVVVSVSEFIQFGPQLQIAKELIDECILEWSQGSNDHITALVNHAFRVDKNNRVNTQAILGLRRLEIREDKWIKAMEAITDSIRVADSKSYIRFYQRPSADADWKAVSLDIAKL